MGKNERFPAIDFPPMMLIQQELPGYKIERIEEAVRCELCRPEVRRCFDRRSRIALALGSRGIACIEQITRAVIGQLREWGHQIFIVPAMGSHGGATPDGQTACLAEYGISEAAMGVPVHSSLDVVTLGEVGPERIPAYFDRIAFDADGVVVINRVKPHTDFRGSVESGLMKMIAVGLGNHRGAIAIHSRGSSGLRELIPLAARLALEKAPIAIGLGIVENAHKQPCQIRALPPDVLEREEEKMLLAARENMPSLPASEIDLLVVNEMGKEISGSGMDPNIIGRSGIRGVPDPVPPRIKKIAVFNLSRISHGNAAGIGLADMITRKMFEQVDFDSTYTNCTTSNFFERAFIPVITETEKDAVELGIRYSRGWDAANARVVRINNTLDLQCLEVSSSIWDEIGGESRFMVVRGPYRWQFSAAGDLDPMPVS